MNLPNIPPWVPFPSFHCEVIWQSLNGTGKPFLVISGKKTLEGSLSTWQGVWSLCLWTGVWLCLSALTLCFKSQDVPSWMIWFHQFPFPDVVSKTSPSELEAWLIVFLALRMFICILEGSWERSPQGGFVDSINPRTSHHHFLFMIVTVAVTKQKTDPDFECA